MICEIKFEDGITDYKDSHEILNIEADVKEVKEIYQIAMRKPLNIPSDLGFSPTPRIISMIKYENFCHELKKRDIKFNTVKSYTMLF